MSPKAIKTDLLVIGGGVNGAGIARDAAGRGYDVVLAEAADLAGATSSASTKLIHGGLRYLEFYEFGLVRKALAEREVLLRLAPHIVWPLRFVLPHDAGQRPAWMIRLGLFLYDHIGGRERLPTSRGLRLDRDPAGVALKPEFITAFEYSDCWVDDARLVVLNAIDARDRGATVLTRTQVLDARPTLGGWAARLNTADGVEVEVAARMIVNAAGPWAGRLIKQLGRPTEHDQLRLVKGSHIVVPRLAAHERAYILQNTDQRIVFIIPYEGDFSLIGTTEQEFAGDPRAAAITEEEKNYLIDCVNRYLRHPVETRDIVWTYSGVRPLIGDESASATAASRDYTLAMEHIEGAPLLSVFGGKITTFREMAAKAVSKIGKEIGRRGDAWSHTVPLPGGDMPGADFDGFLASCNARFPWLGEALCHRLARAYGTRIDRIVGAARSRDDLGEAVVGDLTASEIAYLRAEEFAITAEDILWRRSKLGLHLPADAATRVSAYLDQGPNAQW